MGKALFLLDVQVRDKSIWFASYKHVPKYRRSVIVPGMFPSGKSYMDTTDDNHRIQHEEKHDNSGNGHFEDTFCSMENSPTPADEAHEVSDFPLERCMRIMPHDQNTGAFFIAVIHKHSPLPGVLVYSKLILFCLMYLEFEVIIALDRLTL